MKVNVSEKEITQPLIPTPTIIILPTVTLSPTTVQSPDYLLHKNIKATMFWVGEKATDANDYIPNEASAWDSHWLDSFGGIDNPYTREGYYPKGFVPKENPFYFALPYNDLQESGRKDNITQITWYFSALPENYSLLKNRWVKINYRNETCYAQWEDVGPFEENDIDYVFGNSDPIDDRAGIDFSPALRHCLKMATNDTVDWQFIEADNVPNGPWKKTLTTSQVNWR